MRRLLFLLAALSLSLAVAAPASALTPKNGTYKGKGNMSCPVTPGKPEKKTCTIAVTLKVAKGKISKVDFKRSDGFKFGAGIEGPVKVSSKGKFSSNYKTVSTQYILKGKFSSATKLSASYQAIGALSTEDISKVTFTAKRK